MKVTLYRYEKETLVMRSVEMEKLQAALRTENLNKPVSTTRDKAMFALPGTQNSYIQKLPVVVFGGTFRKTGEPAPPMRDYSGLVLLEVNHLSDLQEAVQIRQQAAMMPQTLLAFVGFSGKSVKIVIPFTLPDGTLPRSPEQVKRFHSQAYLTAVKYYQPQLGRNITLKEPVLQHGCRMSYDPQPVYNPDAVAIRIEQPMRMADSEEIRHPDRATDADGGFGRDPYRPGRTIRTTSKANARYVTQLSDRYTVQHSDGRRHPKIRTNKRRGSQAGLYPISR